MNKSLVDKVESLVDKVESLEQSRDFLMAMLFAGIAIKVCLVIGITLVIVLK